MRTTRIHKEVFKKGSKTYFNSSLFFPRNVRDDVYILYGFVRVADNFVDAVPQQRQEFESFVEKYHDVREGNDVDDIIVSAFVDLERRTKFAPEWTEAFLASMRMDLEKSTYRTVGETLEYVYGSAEVIGLYMSRIMGLSPDADEAACMLGRAMQFINFIRDIDEDNGLGRTYLPLAETSLPNLTRETAEANPHEFRRFVTIQLDRYEQWQARAEQGYAHIPRRYLAPIKTASDMYNWTARQIARNPFVVFERKVKPGRARIVLRLLVNLLAPRKRSRSATS